MDPETVTKKSENPRAFPFKETFIDGSYYATHLGMTLRDYFAGQAIIGIVGSGFGLHRDLAQQAYEIADAMLFTRAKSEPPP
jgi:hypothetical protein